MRVFYQDRYGAAHPIVLLFPHSAAQVHSPEGTITSRLPFTLRFFEHGPPLRNYICTKNKWTQAEFTSINWDAHAAAIKAHSKQKLHITKMLHEVLPTNYNIHRGSPLRQRCPSCFAPKEDRDHIIRCSAAPRTAWRAHTTVVLQERCKVLRTSPKLATILVQGLHAWFEEREFSSNGFPNKFHRLIAQQNAIGWQQIFHGRFSTEWARLQDDHLIHLTHQIDKGAYVQGTMKRTGDQWCQDITTVLWKQWSTLWRLRNEVVHGRDEQDRRRQKEKENMRKLRHIYSQREFMEPSVQELLFDNIQDHEKLPSYAIQNWLAVHESVFAHSIKQVTRCAIQGVRNIRSYFTVTPQQPVLSPTQETEAGTTSLLHIS